MAVFEAVNITDPDFLEGLLRASRIRELERVLIEHGRTGADVIEIVRWRLNALTEAEREAGRNADEAEAAGTDGKNSSADRSNSDSGLEDVSSCDQEPEALKV